MSSFKDRLKESQGGSKTFPKLPIAKTYEMKEDGEYIAFASFDKETGQNVFRHDPINGILIGQAMIMTAYCDNLGPNGGNYRSEHYFDTKSPVALFAPVQGVYKVVHKAAAPDVEKWLVENATSKIAKKRQVLYVLTNEGLVAVITNLSIAIDQISANREALTERYITLYPTLFTMENPSISKRAKEFLGKFAKKNPPKYAEIKVGELISEQDWNNWEADSILDAYKEWKQSKAGKEEGTPAPEPERKDNSTGGGMYQRSVGQQIAEEASQEDVDSLPF